MKKKRLLAIGTGATLFVMFLQLIAGAQTEGGAVMSDLVTIAESTGYRETGRYEEVVRLTGELARRSDLVHKGSFGTSSEGRDIPYLVVSDSGISTPEAARRSGKSVVFIQGAIHSGESDGKDAGLALVRDIALKGWHRDLLRGAIVLFVPIYNVDGHEMFSRYNRINQNGPEQTGFRANSANQNLNRDYMKADTSETRSWLRFWNAWDPDLFIDCHVTDGADFRYNITWEYARHQEAPGPIKEWMKEHFEGRAIPATEAEGNLLSPYIQLADRSDPTKGIFTFVATPKFATGYTPLRNRPGLLIEAHSLKPYKERVKGTYDLLVAMIREASDKPGELKAANGAADAIAEARGSGKRDSFPLRLSVARTPTRNIEFKGVDIRYEDSEASGSKRLIYGTVAKDVEIPWFDTTEVVASAAPPSYYLVPPQWQDVIERLDLHGISYRKLKDEMVLNVESYRFEEPKWASAPFEGRMTLSAKTTSFSEERSFPKGTAVVPVAQKASAVLIHLLEPAGPDSLFYWGFFNAIFESKEYAETYALEELAAKLLAENSEIKKEFEEKLKDEKFAADPRKRLAFFYERSGYKEVTGIYPVGRFNGKLP